MNIHKTRAWYRVLRQHLLLPIACLAIACTPPPQASAPTGDNAAASVDPGKDKQPSVSLDALDYLGFPFKKRVYYKLTRPEQTIEGAREFRSNVSESKVTIDVSWSGEIANVMGSSEQFVADAEGVRATMAQGTPITPPPLYLPANPVPGKKWSANYKFDSPNVGTFDVNANYAILAEESVTVPLGKFTAIVLKETGTLKSASQTITVSGKTWFARGVGMVKAEHELSQTGTDRKTTKSKLSFVAIPEPKE